MQKTNLLYSPLHSRQSTRIAEAFIILIDHKLLVFQVPVLQFSLEPLNILDKMVECRSDIVGLGVSAGYPHYNQESKGRPKHEREGKRTMLCYL